VFGAVSTFSQCGSGKAKAALGTCDSTPERSGEVEAWQAGHAGRMRPGSQSVCPHLPESLSDSLATSVRK